MTINSPAAMLLAFYLCVGEEQGVPRDRAARDDPDGHPQGVHRAEGVDLPARAVDAAGRRHDRVLRAARCRCWHPISISGYHIREAGSTAAQELAFTLADGFAYVEAAIERGLDVDDFAPRLSLLLQRAPRLLRGDREVPRGAADLGARAAGALRRARIRARWLMRFHTQTAGVSLTAQQPEVNIVRTALEALAAVLGGTQSLHTNSFDEALALPTENAVRLALRTQQVIAHETGVVNTIDPLGGSYYVEDLTNRLEAEAYEYFDRIREARRRRRRRSRRTSSSARSPRRRSATSPRSSAKQRVDRRRQPLRARGRGAARDPPHRPGARAAADRARAGAAGAARLGRGRVGARAAEGRPPPREDGT